jgi:hypothetical protein
MAGSHVRGSTAALTATQLASSRYYQRPDQDYVSVDPDATSLSGYSSGAFLQKTGGDWTWRLGGSAVSPGYELNDAGFQLNADRLIASGGITRAWVRPGKVFRSFTAQLNANQAANYGGVNVGRSLALGLGGSFHNLWGVNLQLSRNFAASNDRVTRGGPIRLQPSSTSIGLQMSTDSRNAVAGSAYVSYVDASSGAWARFAGASLTFRPQGAFDVTVFTDWYRSREDAFYVTQGADATADATFGRRYLFATLDQHSLDTRVRLNWLLSPNLSIQLYAQPLLATGDYTGFKALARPGSYDFLEYGTGGSSITFDGGAERYTTLGGPGADPVSFTNPDFRFRSLRSNLVLRWEYRAGSTLFLVWNQTRGSRIFDPAWNGLGDLWDLRHDPQQNIFLIKFNYYLNL